MKVFLLALLIVIASSVITTHKNRLIDQYGREVIFHGLNVVMKIDPYIPDLQGFSLDTSFSEIDMQNLKNWGINSIRLGVMWAGVEPKEGHYNQTYLNLMRKLVDKCQQFNISVLVEFHQDLFSEKFCGDGVPLWAIPKTISATFPLPIDKPYKYGDDGLPTECGKHPWGSYYASWSVNQGFNMLYNNKKLLNKFVNYWEKIAETFANSSNVIAYQLINQPWPGNMWTLPIVMIPHLSQGINLQGVYDTIAKAIRKIDPHNSIGFQPVTWDNIIPSGFRHPPGGKKHANKSIFCYHYYNPPTVNLEGFFETRMNDIQRLHSGGIMSEMYVIGDEGKRNQEAMDIMDTKLQSWFGWIYKSYIKGQKNTFFYNSDSSEKIESIDIISRTYAQAVAGKTLSQSFDRKSKQFRLRYQLCVECGETVIYYNERAYTEGVNVTIEPSDAIEYSIEKNFVRVYPNSRSKKGQYTVVTVANHRESSQSILVLDDEQQSTGKNIQ